MQHTTGRTARVIIIGDEVLTAEVVDANGPFILKTLSAVGTRVTGLRVVPDSPPLVIEAVREGRDTADLVVVTGGIGPTHDDCTRPAVARAMDRELKIHPEARERIHRIFDGQPTPDEAEMARLPRGAVVLTAPRIQGFAFQVEEVVVFPGVPVLLRELLTANANRLGGRPWSRREIETTVREGRLARPLRDLAGAWPDVAWGSYPELAGSGWTLRIVLRGEDPERLNQAEKALRVVLEKLKPDQHG